jgi:hypothetical protein
MRLTALAVLALAVALVPRGAAAQTSETCVLLPHASDEVPAAVWERVDGAVSEALRARGVVVLAARDAQLRMMGQPMEDCGAIDCAPEVNRFLGTAFAVLTEVTWSRGRASAVNVVLIGVESGHSAGAQAAVERPAALEESTLSAFGVAWDRWEADRQGQLLVETSPEGAFVEVDGVSVGRAPLRRLVPIGVHTLRFALEGYVTETREITIDRHEERSVSVTLGPLGGAEEGPAAAELPGSPSSAPPVDRDHPWANWLLGGGLLAAGLGLAVQPLVVIALNRQPAGGGRLYTPTDGDWALAGTLLALSGASLVAGAVVMATQPIRESVTLTAGIGWLDLRVTF